MHREEEEGGSGKADLPKERVVNTSGSIDQHDQILRELRLWLRLCGLCWMFL